MKFRRAGAGALIRERAPAQLSRKSLKKDMINLHAQLSQTNLQVN
jgi:hypothetical protein